LIALEVHRRGGLVLGSELNSRSLGVFLEGAVATVNSIQLAYSRESGDARAYGRHPQTDLVGGHRVVLITSSLEAEILTLRHQLNVLRRKSLKRLAFSNFDRLIFAGLYRIAPRIANALVIVQPETVIRWHRAGFRLFWRWKSRAGGGRPKVALEIRQLIRAMSLANPLWGAPRIRGGAINYSFLYNQQLRIASKKHSHFRVTTRTHYCPRPCETDSAD
jgi:hypothetical protein